MIGAHPDIYVVNFETRAFLEGHDTGPLLEIASARREQIICEKTPKHIHRAAQIFEQFPLCRIVKIVRDPRDTVVSLMKRNGGKFEPALNRWMQDNSAPVPGALLVRYEDLINDPTATLTTVCNYIGVAFDLAMLEYWKDEREWFGATERRDTDGSNGPNHITRRNWQIHQPILSDRIGIYRGALTDSQIGVVVHQTSALARQHGYDVT
jgi:protein O-GlcNAc transferase